MSKITFKQAEPLVLADIKANLTPALLGKPGIGKSEFLKGLAVTLRTKVFILAVNQLADRTDLTGARTLQRPDGTYAQEFFPHATVKDAIEYAKTHPNETPILFLDEFNRTSVDVTSACFTFITDRRIGNECFPENIRFVVAGNNEGHITSVDDASVTRLSVYEMQPDSQTFLQVQPDLNPYVREVIQANADLIVAETYRGDDELATSEDDETTEDFAHDLDFGEQEQFQQLSVPRTITNTGKWLSTLNIDASGSQEERDMLSAWLSSVPTVGANASVEEDTLMIGLRAHAGNTAFTSALYDRIKTQYDSYTTTPIAAAAGSSTSSGLTRFRPEQELINQLYHAQNNQDIETIVANLAQTQDKLIETLLWAMTEEAAAEVSNVQIVRSFVQHGFDKSNPLERAMKQIVASTGSATNLNQVVIDDMSGRSNTVEQEIIATLAVVGAIEKP